MSDPIGPLIERFHAFDVADAPAEVRAFAAEAFANIVGVAVGGATEETTRRALDAMAVLGGERQAVVVGTSVERTITQVALVEGIAAHVLDFDDTDLATIYHPSATPFGAIAAVGQWVDASGAELLASWIVGLETGIRLASALGMPHYDRGWHVTGTAGAVAAAAATAHLMHLEPPAFATALNLAATMSGGHRTHFGSDAKSGHAGFAAQHGVEAVLLAREGFTASPLGITGPRGLLGIVGPDGDHTQLLEGLGSRWRLLDDRLKPYASGVVTHPAIDIAREIRRRHGADPTAYRSIRLDVHPLVKELTGIREPTTGLQGKFSVWHCFAAGLIHDRAAVREYSDLSIVDPTMRAARDLVEVNVEERRRHMTVAAEVVLADGTRDEVSIDAPRGSDERPLTSDEVRDKFVDLLGPRMASASASAWFDRLVAVEGEASAKALFRELDGQMAATGTHP